jgi:sugar/nucleoside kinase (ribokinase family)
MFGGGEANVAMPRARSGILAAAATALPDNGLGEAARSFLLGGGVDDADIVVAPGRILKPGAAQRASRLLHDRAESSLARADAGVCGWPRLLDGAGRRTC